ncbi:MAG: hypothetical protein ACPGPE_12325 [Planctomycetota bacterium]
MVIASAACASSRPRPIHGGPVPATRIEASGELKASVGAFDPGRLATDDAAAEGVAAPGSESAWPSFDLEVASVSSAGDKTVRVGLAGAWVGLDLEDLLGLNRSNTTVKAKGYWRLRENQRQPRGPLVLDLNRQGTKTVSQDIDLGGGDVISAGTAATTRPDLRLIKAQYSDSFFQDERVDLGGGGSRYVLPIDFQLEACGVSDTSDSFGVTALLPAVGLRFDLVIHLRWLLQSDLNVFRIEFDDGTGALTSWTGGVECRPWGHFALGSGLESSALGVEQSGRADIPGAREAGSIALSDLGLGFSLRPRW